VKVIEYDMLATKVKKIVVAIVEQLRGGGRPSHGGPDNVERKVFCELGRDDLTFHVESASATADTGSGHLPLSLEPIPPPPYVARDALGSFSVMSPGATSFIQPTAVPAGNALEMNTCYVQQQQHMSMSPFNASARSLYGTHLGAEPPQSLLSSSTYSDTVLPSARNVSNGYLYPAGTDSRFSSQFLVPHSNINDSSFKRIKLYWSIHIL